MLKLMTRKTRAIRLKLDCLKSNFTRLLGSLPLEHLGTALTLAWESVIGPRHLWESGSG